VMDVSDLASGCYVVRLFARCFGAEY